MKIKGLDKLQAQLKELGPQLGGKALTQAGREAFRPVLEAAKALAPSDTGALRESLRLGTAKIKDGVAVGVVIGGGARAKQAKVAAAAFGERHMPPARRWHMAEFGTANQPAQPFLRPAIDSQAASTVERLKPALQRAIARAVKKRGGG